MKFVDPESKEAERKRNLARTLNAKSNHKKTFIERSAEWVKHPINRTKLWLIRTFPNHFNVG
jgi:hypothetical protein